LEAEKRDRLARQQEARWLEDEARRILTEQKDAVIPAEELLLVKKVRQRPPPPLSPKPDVSKVPPALPIKPTFSPASSPVHPSPMRQNSKESLTTPVRAPLRSSLIEIEPSPSPRSLSPKPEKPVAEVTVAGESPTLRKELSIPSTDIDALNRSLDEEVGWVPFHQHETDDEVYW